MTNPALLPTIGLMGATVLLFYRAVYWQERKGGRSHEASLVESSLLSVFLLGSAAIEYAAVVANYS